MTNVPLHQALTDDELDLHAYFGEDDYSDAVSEYSLIGGEEDPFTPAAANDLLFTLPEKKTSSRLNCRLSLQNYRTKDDYLKKWQKRCSNKH